MNATNAKTYPGGKTVTNRGNTVVKVAAKIQRVKAANA